MEDYQRRLAAIGNLGDPALMSELGKGFVERAQRIVPVSKEGGSHGDPPGTLRESIQVAEVTDTSVTIIAGGEKYPAARAVEFGTGFHRIGPNRARRLRFFWTKESRMFIGLPGQSVRKEAQKAQPFFRPTMVETGLVAYLRAALVSRWNNAA